ncbi:AraC family transcriptional regulator [Paenibacillus sp. MMS20-IR301]|uniref:helix-turn-helix domain-containing protein n=1 Tax=Paenibacillus sp. MMS20-IR301 TaxID=2895946 RepID=UPI0028E7D12E|nr:AraC family transcriptional regulator [Paenibacillus sp. MMS20-IR301]WNS46045.1 AraC family transcriptional regulator [Paenibacillus sp. MMS20-IR301]
MTHIHYVESNTVHTGNFVIDVPVGYHWLLVVTKTPGQFWVNGRLEEYPAHSVILYRPQQKVYYRACTSQFVNDWIRFESDEHYITESPLPFGVPFALSDPDYCQKLFELLVSEHNFNRDCRESSISLLLRTLFNKLWESYFQDNITPQYYKLLKLRTAVQSNPGDYWTVSKMADSLRISPGYLQNIYKKTFGISCMDDVIASRIRMAKEYLIHNAQSIAEVASRCGYQNVEHFCRQFKQITGHTPRSYQKQVKG